MRYCHKYQMARLQMQCGPLFLVLLYILYVIGTTKDGKEVTIFTSGEWAF